MKNDGKMTYIKHNNNPWRDTWLPSLQFTIGILLMLQMEPSTKPASLEKHQHDEVFGEKTHMKIKNKSGPILYYYRYTHTHLTETAVLTIASYHDYLFGR